MMLKNITNGAILIVTEEGTKTLCPNETIKKDLVLNAERLLQIKFVEVVEKDNNAEKERLAKEQAEKEKLAKEQAEKLAKEEAERLAKEQAEKESANVVVNKPKAPAKSK